MSFEVDSVRRFLDTETGFNPSDDARIARSHLKALLEYTEKQEKRLVDHDSLNEELSRLKALFELMDSSSARAIKMWREETGKDYVWPDRTELIKWLLDQLETATQERDQARKYGSAAHTISVMCEALDRGGVSASKLAEMLSQPMSEMRTAGIQRVANALFDACHGEVYADELETAKETIKLLSEREPTQKEADRARSSAAGGNDSTSDNECFVELGGWTSRRCADCNKWVFGGPTRCSICVAISDPH